MRRDTEFRDAVHFFRTDLNFKRLTVAGHNRGVQGLVLVGLGRSDVILDAPGDRFPLLVDSTQNGVTFLDVLYDNAHRGQIVNLFQGLTLVFNLFIDGVEVLGSAENFPFNLVRLHQILDFIDDYVDKFFTFRQLRADVVRKILVRFTVEIFQAQVFEFALDLRDTQSPCQRRVNIQRFVCHTLLSFLGKEVERTHIVQTVGEFDDDNAHVLCHSNENFTEIFRIFVFFGFENDFFQFCNTTYKP